MKNKIALLTVLFIISLNLMSCKKEIGEDLLFFYFESCPSCEEYQLAEDFNEIIDFLDKKAQWNGAHYNLISPEAGDELKRILSEKEMPDISRSLPLLIIGDEYINGYENIGLRLETYRDQ